MFLSVCKYRCMNECTYALHPRPRPQPPLSSLRPRSAARCSVCAVCSLLPPQTPQLYLWLYGGGPGQGAAQPVPT